MGLCIYFEIVIGRFHQPQNNSTLPYERLLWIIPLLDNGKAEQAPVELNGFFEVRYVQPYMVNP